MARMSPPTHTATMASVPVAHNQPQMVPTIAHVVFASGWVDDGYKSAQVINRRCGKQNAATVNKRMQTCSVAQHESDDTQAGCLRTTQAATLTRSVTCTVSET